MVLVAASLKRVLVHPLLADLQSLNAKLQPAKRLLLKELIGKIKSSLWPKPMECPEFKSQKYI
tara:strand:+ start:314 stop:502 length:189 start_codon:yes stop_codon:yes gene_type:complete